MKIAVIVGHTSKSKGAYSKYFKMREFDFYSKVAELLNDVDVYFYDEKISGYVTRVKALAAELNKKDYDLVIELHFNHFRKASANGCETLYFYASKNGKYYASLFSETLNDYTGIKLRNGGLKALANTNDRGFHAVYQPKAPAILIEPFFGSNKSDCEKIESIENLACIINEYTLQIQ
jgi:N-acetylmuramoyl-L-alanine amidase